METLPSSLSCETTTEPKFPLAPVTISPNEIKSVDVSEAVVKDAPQLAGFYGSVVFRYTSLSNKNLYAAVMVFDGGHPIAFHMDTFADVPEFNVGSREGIWWLPSATVRDYLVLTNKSQRPLLTTLRLYDAKGKSFAQPIMLKPPCHGAIFRAGTAAKGAASWAVRRNPDRRKVWRWFPGHDSHHVRRDSRVLCADENV